MSAGGTVHGCIPSATQIVYYSAARKHKVTLVAWGNTRRSPFVATSNSAALSLCTGNSPYELAVSFKNDDYSI